MTYSSKDVECRLKRGKKRKEQEMKQNKTAAEKSALMCIFRDGFLAITLTCKLSDFLFLSKANK